MNKKIFSSTGFMVGAGVGGIGVAAKLGSKIAKKVKGAVEDELSKIKFGKGIKSIIPSREITIQNPKLVRKEFKKISSIPKEVLDKFKGRRQRPIRKIPL